MGNRLIEALKTGQRYIFQIRAKNDIGLFGAYSAVVEITTSIEDTPRAPTNVVLTGVVEKWVGTKYKTTLTLTWTAPIEVVISKYEAILEEYSSGAWAVADVTNAEAYPAKTATEQKWVDYTPSGEYRAKIRTISKGNTVGTWSDYATCTTTFTSDLPTPTGLTLKQEGKIITASVDVISQATYPQLAGYRFYASKQTAFTPGATNLIAEPKSNSCTFQEAYDSGDAVIEEIAIGDTIYVRVSAFDAAGSESLKCAEISILAGGAIPDAPTFDGTHKLVLTATTILGRVYQVKADLKWIAPTNVELGSYEVEIYNALNGGGTLEKTLSPAKGTTQCAYTDSDPNTDYSARIRAVNQWGRIGTWSAYSNASGTIPSQNTPTPTNLALKQDGKLVTATVDRFSLITYPDVKRYKFYAAKGTGFTPGTANLVGDAQSNTCTFQVAANAGTGVLEEIAIGDTIYVRVATADADERIGTKCAEISILAGGAIPDAPASVTLTLTPTTILGRVYNIKAASAWTAPTNVELGGYEQEIYNAYNGGGTLEKTLSPGLNATVSNWTDNEPNANYSTRIRAINKWERTGTWSSWANAASVVDVTAPASPTGVVLNTIAGLFEIKVDKNTEADMHEYIVYVNTTNSVPTKGDTEHIIKRVAHPTTRTVLPLGAKTEAATNIITLTTGTTYYFWASATDVAHNESALVASSPASASVGTPPVISTTPPTPNPPTGMGNDAVEYYYVARITKARSRLYWGACTGDLGKPITYEVRIWPSGSTTKVTTFSPTDTNYTVTDLVKDTTYYWKVKAIDWQNNETSFCADQTLTVGHSGVSPSAPGVAQISVKGNSFIISWATVVNTDLKYYIIYVYTSNDSASAKAIKSRASSITETEVDIGTITWDAALTLAYDTNYYFWVSAVNEDGSESSKTACTGNPKKVNKTEWLQHFTIPWKIKGLLVDGISIGQNATASFNPGSGKVALIVGYYMDGKGSSASININDLTHESDTAPVARLPKETNGIYLDAGDHVDMTTPNVSGAYARARFHRWDADPDITVVCEQMTYTTIYTVPSGKNFILTFLSTDAVLCELEVSTDGGANYYAIWEISADPWDLTKGALVFGAGHKLRAHTTATLRMFGILVAEP